LAEAVQLIRQLWTGESVTHRGPHFTVENARIYTRPSGDIPVPISAFGEQALALAAEHGDGWVTTGPDPDMLRQYRDAGGAGAADGALTACRGVDGGSARKLAHELWSTGGVSGQHDQELPRPVHGEQAASIVTEQDGNEARPCGPDPEPYVEA